MRAKLTWTLSHTDWTCNINVSENSTLKEIKENCLKIIGKYGLNITNLKIEIFL